MAVVKWTFFDPVVNQTYVFEINPNEGGSPSYEKNILEQSTSAPDGKTLLFEGRDPVQRLNFSGILRSQEQYDAFVLWHKKRRQIRVTDDLGRTYWVYLTKFIPTRRRAAMAPWKHEYQVESIILDWS